jgi:phosphatidylinositol alpha-1,6-mannosyltransferase
MPESLECRAPDQAPKVLALVGDCYGSVGGIAQYNQDLFRALAPVASGIVVLSRLGTGKAEDIPARVEARTPTFSLLRFIWGAVVEAIRLRPDIVFCGHVGMMPLAWLIARTCGSWTWLQTHGVEAWPRPAGWRRWFIERADLITSVSRVTRRRLLAWAAIAQWRVRVLPNTVRPCFNRGPKSPTFAEANGLSGRRVLLTVSRLVSTERSKGHDEVMAAVAVLRAEFPDLLYVIVGTGDDRERLEDIARDRGVSASVRFWGYATDAELVELYRLAEVYAMPASTEGFGIVFLEAGMCGLPVVGGDADGAVDALRDGEAGQMIAPGDTGALTKALRAVMRERRRVDPAVLAPFGWPHFCERARMLARAITAQPSHVSEGVD